MKLSLVSLTGLVSLVLAAASISACTSPSSPTGCDGIEIDAQKELVIVEPSVIQGPRAENGGAGALSFRHAAERQAPGFAASLFDAYASVAPARGAALESRVVSKWRASGFDLAASPLRLIAVANRIDLADQPDELGTAGEARLVFAITDGPADDPASVELPMTIILEYSLSGGRRAWTSDFHALSRYVDFSDAYVAALEALVVRFDRVSQVRINDAAFGEGQLFAELALDGPLLAPRGLRNTPDAHIDPARLASLVSSNADAIIENKWLLPRELRTKTIDASSTWSLPGVAADARQAFAQGTCNGCHGQVQPSTSGFHVAPGASGASRLSKFLYDPTNANGDELTRRAKSASTTLCSP
jgi:hypothetical protein